MSISAPRPPDVVTNEERAPAPARRLSEGSARHLLGIRPERFRALARAGVFRMAGGAFDEATLHRNHALAVAAERDAQSRIATIEAELRARLAAIGTTEG